MSVSAKKDPNGTWHIQFRYTDWKGRRKKTQKRGFKTKKEAEEWLTYFLLQQAGDIRMPFKEFWEIYKEDMGKRIRRSTMRQKEYMVQDKLMPYFGETPLNEISVQMIRRWQGEMLERNYSPTYLKSIYNHLNAILNYAVKYYNLKTNPCHRAGSIGKEKADEMDYWTLEEFNTFVDALIEDRVAWTMFNLLFWTGMRLGEMLALTVEDFDFENNIITVNKSLNRLDKEDVITPPKTEASKRKIKMSSGLSEIMHDYIKSMYRPKKASRLFEGYSKHYVEKAFSKGIKNSGVKKIHVHCLRHSHASMLVQAGFNPVEIAARLGHAKVTTTIETYCHAAENAQDQIANTLSNFERKAVYEG